jgi:hypothetical protein
VIREPAEPIGDPAALTRVGIGGNEDLLKKVDTKGLLISQLVGE